MSLTDRPGYNALYLTVVSSSLQSSKDTQYSSGTNA